MGKDIHVVSMDVEAIAAIKKNSNNKIVIQIKDDRFGILFNKINKKRKHSTCFLFSYSYRSNPLSLSKISRSVPSTAFINFFKTSFSLRESGSSSIGFLSTA